MDTNGFRLGPVNNGSLGVLNLSLVDNGLYDLELTVRASYRQSSTNVRFALERDQITNIVHKNSGATVLASVAYERAPFGEPTKITREDSSYVILKYDSALRLTNEQHYASGGGLIESIGYGYDASGSRIRLSNNTGTFTNTVEKGYRVTAVRRQSDGATTETYAYDAGGRITSINRSSSTLNLGYNTADQLTAVTNGVNWTQYTHDASGRRTKAADQSGAQRRFLVADSPGTDLESPHLIADANNSVKQAYVYLGNQPIVRFDSSGSASRVYYLEDSMGSIIGLTPQGSPDPSNTSRLFYDGFGSTRSTNGPTPTIPSGCGGDFRFHGEWWESATALYHMRAREYDSRTGRFVSRDPRDGISREPESFHPYAFARNNAHVYADPTGEFSLTEINLANLINAGLQAIRVGGVAEVRRQVLGRVSDAILELSKAKLSTLLPPKLLERFQGIHFENVVRRTLCEFADGYGSYFHFAVPLNREGTPIGDGVSCSETDPDSGELKKGAKAGVKNLKDYAWPDFIIGDKPPKSKKGYPQTWVVGDIKRATKSLHNAYIKKKSNSQFPGMVNYARKHTYSRAAIFIVALKTPGKQYQTVEATLMRKAVALGGLAYVDTLFDGKGKRRRR